MLLCIHRRRGRTSLLQPLRPRQPTISRHHRRSDTSTSDTCSPYAPARRQPGADIVRRPGGDAFAGASRVCSTRQLVVRDAKARKVLTGRCPARSTTRARENRTRGGNSAGQAAIGGRPNWGRVVMQSAKRRAGDRDKLSVGFGGNGRRARAASADYARPRRRHLAARSDVESASASETAATVWTCDSPRTFNQRGFRDEMKGGCLCGGELFAVASARAAVPLPLCQLNRAARRWSSRRCRSPIT